MTQWTLQPILHPWVLLGIAVVLVGALLIRPAFQTATARRVFWLRLMRFGMIGFLMLAMLRPGCVKTVEKQQAAVLVMLCDISRSMQLALPSSVSVFPVYFPSSLCPSHRFAHPLGSSSFFCVCFFGFNGKTRATTTCSTESHEFVKNTLHTHVKARWCSGVSVG